ncbi:MAG: GNAT family N-acetyltransferase [Anaerolinea sp.]|nr:GNAT family N-acetyltransferase [Anaerolinea sp.]
MKPPERLETSRLLLRKPVLEDADAIFHGHASDPQVTRYLTWKTHTDIEMSRAYLQRCILCWKDVNGTAFPWVIVHKKDERLVGTIEMRVLQHRADLGYGLARAYWGNGIATEATNCLVEWALAQPEIFRVWAICDVDNTASSRVLEKVGMQCEGILRRYSIRPNLANEPRDSFCYSIVK